MGRIKTTLSSEWIEVPADEEQAVSIYEEYRETLEKLRELHDESHEDEVLRADLGRALGRFAEAACLHGDFTSALNARDESAQIWSDMGRHRACVLARIQAANMAHLAGVPNAWKRFETLAELVRDPLFEIYADFLLEYRALASCRESRFEDALALMERALERRIDEGRKERQLEETRELIRRIKASIK